MLAEVDIVVGCLGASSTRVLFLRLYPERMCPSYVEIGFFPKQGRFSCSSLDLSVHFVHVQDPIAENNS